MAPILPFPDDHLLFVGLDAFKSTIEVFNALRDYSKTAGFAVYKIRTKRPDKNKVPGRIDVGCDRGVAGRPLQAKLRNTSTRKAGCGWKAKILNTGGGGPS